ncbi:MAG: hypothetical protein AB7U75_05820 [Hyphomicrobiaceae bacterium]
MPPLDARREFSGSLLTLQVEFMFRGTTHTIQLIVSSMFLTLKRGNFS